MDNGTPWGSPGDLPTDLVLWLAGLGIGVWPNPPRRPQDNGVVERSQGTGKRWGDPQHATSVADLQATMDRMDEIQREKYPYRQGASRLAVYPGLRHSGRAYTPAGERAAWSLARAHDLLAQFVVARQVSRSGTVSVYHRSYYVGRAYAGQPAFVRFDPQQQRWLFYDQGNRLVNQHEAPEVGAQPIRTLQVTDRREGARASSRGKT